MSIAAIVCAIGVIVVGTALRYLWHAYAPTYVLRAPSTLSAALGATTIAGVVAVVCYPISGWIAELFGSGSK